MPSAPPQHRPPGWVKRAYDRERGSASKRGYDRAWERVRAQVLADEPLCRFCAERGRVTPAVEVDHIEPISRRPELRLDRCNLRPLCKPCHSGRTAREQTPRG